jgi:hypothetical protein
MRGKGGVECGDFGERQDRMRGKGEDERRRGTVVWDGEKG